MIDLNKLKSDHDRYKKALELLVSMYDEPHAKAALNPPPPPPVTLDLLIAALKRYSLEHPSARIVIFDDESGGVERNSGRIFSFKSLQEAYNFLTQ